MARINRDSDSWKAGGIIKRDFNHAHDEPEVPKHNPAKRTKKNTKRWCRGKEGREHRVTTYIEPPHRDDYSCCSGRDAHRRLHHRRIIKCVVCGMEGYNLPDEAIAQIDERTRIRLEAEAEWCQEGHLYDWQSNMTGPPKAFEKDLRFKGDWHRDRFDLVFNFGWRSGSYEHEYCQFCGKKGKMRRRS